MFETTRSTLMRDASVGDSYVFEADTGFHQSNNGTEEDIDSRFGSSTQPAIGNRYGATEEPPETRFPRHEGRGYPPRGIFDDI